jgi:hypothetical protein
MRPCQLFFFDPIHSNYRPYILIVYFILEIGIIRSSKKPMPPTGLFRLEMQVIEAQQRIEQVKRLQRGSIAA